MKRALLIVAVLFLFAGQARAEIMAASSIEWLSCQSDVIVVGRITDINVTKGVHDVIYEDWTVDIQETLKGDIKDDEIGVCLRTLSADLTGKTFMNSKDGVLLFLSKSKDHGPEPHLDDKYVPTSLRDPFSIVDLSNVPKNIYSKDMTILTNKREILNVTRSWADSKIAHSLSAEVPFDSPLFKQLYAGSACYLIVPAEEAYRARFMKQAQSDKPNERRKAASELYKFPGEATTRVLRELLNDDTERFWHFSADTISNVEYGVRTAAYRSLQALGESVPDDLELERKPTEAEQRALRESYWRKAFAEALPEGWDVKSVEDGSTRRVEDRDTTSVVVTCSNGELRCTFTLIPKEWNRDVFPSGKHLGINGRTSQGARHFICTETTPEVVREKVSGYFGLE